MSPSILAAFLSLALSAGLLSEEPDQALSRYQERAQTVLQGNQAILIKWAEAQANAAAKPNTVKASIWTAAAGFCLSDTNPALLTPARTLAAKCMESRLKRLFAGGNDGWEAWATADTCVRYRDLITSDPARYAPAGYVANPQAEDGKYSLDDLFKIVLTQSYYAPIDSTSNHYLMNATARFLAEVAYPGDVILPFNRNTKDPFGAEHIIARARSLEHGGPGEYGSPNYGADNWAEFLSLLQLTPTTTPKFAEVKKWSTGAYAVALADAGAFWMNGNLAMSTGRGYPATGAWGVAAGDALTWVYYGGDFGNPNLQATVLDTNVKTLAVLGAVGFVDGYSPPAGLLHLADRVPRVSKANFGQNRQYSYMTADYGHSSESCKEGGHGGWQTHWNSRVVWTKPYDHTYQATAWVTNVCVDAQIINGIVTPKLHTDGKPKFVDPYTLQPIPLWGSANYGTGPYEDYTQWQDTVLHVMNIPPREKAGTPGGCMPTRGALVYMPIPLTKNSAGAFVPATENYLPPVLSNDNKRIYVGYNSVFIAFLSTAPIATPVSTDIIVRSKTDRQQFFRIYGEPERDVQTDPNAYIQFAVAVQTAAPKDFEGATLAEQFQKFSRAMDQLALPHMAKVDTLHPIWQFANGQVTLSNTYQGDRYHGGNDGKGDDWIGGPNNENPTRIDYKNWPQLQQEQVGLSAPTVSQPQKGNMTVRFPGTPTTLFDLTSQLASTFELPVDVDDSASTTSGHAVTGNVLSNDQTPNAGKTLQAIMVGEPVHGTMILESDGSFTYTPEKDFVGTDNITYRADDSLADSNVATVTITVTENASSGAPSTGGVLPTDTGSKSEGSSSGGSGGGCGLGSGLTLVVLLGLGGLRLRRGRKAATVNLTGSGRPS